MQVFGSTHESRRWLASVILLGSASLFDWAERVSLWNFLFETAHFLAGSNQVFHILELSAVLNTLQHISKLFEINFVKSVTTDQFEFVEGLEKPILGVFEVV